MYSSINHKQIFGKDGISAPYTPIHCKTENIPKYLTIKGQNEVQKDRRGT